MTGVVSVAHNECPETATARLALTTLCNSRALGNRQDLEIERGILGRCAGEGRKAGRQAGRQAGQPAG